MKPRLLILPCILTISLVFGADELSAEEATICPTCVSCSSRPDVVPCFLRPSASLVPSPELKANTSNVAWGSARPFGLQIFTHYKTNKATGDLQISASLRWQLASRSSHVISTPVQGFQVTVVDKATNATTVEYTALLPKPVLKVTPDVTALFFTIDSDNMFLFGREYEVTVSLLPQGVGGVEQRSKKFPQHPDKSCELNEERRELAQSWATQFESIRLIEASSSVNVSFLSAPASLCIQHYLVLVQQEYGSVLSRMVINQTGSATVLHHLFEALPRETGIVVKVKAYSMQGQICPCKNCNCLAVGSQTFKIPAAVKEAAPTVIPLTISQTSASNRASLLFLLLCIVTLVLLVLFALFLFAFLLHKKNKVLRKKINILQSTVQLVSDDYGKSMDILLIAPDTDHEERDVADQLARLLRASHHNVAFDRFDETVDQNVHRWTRTALAKAHKIFVVHSAYSTQNDITSTYRNLLDTISLNDDRVLHIKLHPSVRIAYANVLETTYVFPRDVRQLCLALELPYDCTWMEFERKCSRMYSHRSSATPLVELTSSDELSQQDTPLLGTPRMAIVSPFVHPTTTFTSDSTLSKEKSASLVPLLEQDPTSAVAVESEPSRTLDSGMSSMADSHELSETFSAAHQSKHHDDLINESSTDSGIQA